METDRLLAGLATEVPEDYPGASEGEDLDASLAGKRVYVSTLEYTLAQFRARSDFKAVTAWDLCSRNVDVMDWRNLSGRTLSERISSGLAMRLGSEDALIHMYVPFGDSDFQDMGYKIILLSGQSRIFSNLPFVELTHEQHLSPTLFFPELELSGPDAMPPDSAAEFMCSPFYEKAPTMRALQVDLENINGYLPKTRLNLTGPETFKIHSFGLEPGDEIKIKAGFRYRPAVVEKIVRIM
ncbi:MAG: hypothetical protein LBP98_02690 [Tannerella sp.]|nr:hypothetical protein [Tannerella sp.]